MAAFGFLLTRSPYVSAGASSFYLLAKEALAAGHSVQAFFFADGVFHCMKEQKPIDESEHSHLDWLAELINNGAKVSVSHSCLEMRGLDADSLHSSVRMGTLDDLSELIACCDKVVCL